MPRSTPLLKSIHHPRPPARVAPTTPGPRAVRLVRQTAFGKGRGKKYGHGRSRFVASVPIGMIVLASALTPPSAN
jgi:hypothetical protein